MSTGFIDPGRANERRKAIGMEALEERTVAVNADQRPEKITAREYSRYKTNYQNWLRKVGWRK